MATVFHGNSVVTQSAQKTFSVRTGFKFRQVYLCAGSTVAYTQQGILTSAGYDPVEVNPGPGMWEVVANASFDPDNPNQSIHPSWQIQKYSVDGDILDPKTNPTANKVHPKHLQVLMAARKNPPVNGLIPVFDGTVSTPNSSPSEQLRLAMSLWTAIQMGFNGSPLEYPILKRTYAIWDSYIITDTLNNVGNTIISTATLIASEGVPNAYASIIPSSGDEDLSIPYLKMKTGWVKSYPDVNTIGDAQSQVGQEWKYGKWLTLDYPYSI